MKMRFPMDFWLRVLGDFLTGFGRSMLIPFMLIYLKQEGGFPTWVVTLMTAVPQFFQLFSTSWGGVLADYYGRKPIMLFSLAGSGLILTLMLNSNYLWVYAGYVFFLILSNFYRPAAMAMVTEVIPQERHREAFAILRMMANLGFALGPLVGSLLFFTHREIAILGTMTAYLLTSSTVFLMHETGRVLKNQSTANLTGEFQNPLRAFKLLKRDSRLLWAVTTGVFFLMVQLQLFSSFTVVVNDAFRDQGRTLSYLLLVNTAGVVLGQVYITNRTQGYSFFRLLQAAVILSAVAWGLLLFPGGAFRYYLLLGLTTLAEMLMAAVYTPYIASLAQEGEIAQYMSFTQTSNILGQMFGPTIGAIGYDIGGQKGYVFFLWGLLIITSVNLRKLKRIDKDELRRLSSSY
jgi:MFS family permease